MEKHSLQVWSPQLRNHQAVDVYLPDSYGLGKRRYPVVYAQDGQNLSDPSTAFGGQTWQLENALEYLRSRGIEPIVVGVHNMEEHRIREYTPFTDSRHGGGDGIRYCRFLTDTLKPRIDAQYRTSRNRSGTAILGSSLGGLISLYAFFLRPSPYGAVGALSPSVWYANRLILDFVERSRYTRGRIYLDVGTAEGAVTMRDVRALVRLLRVKGYRRRSSLRYVEAGGHRHTESDWARRLPMALEFLLR